MKLFTIRRGPGVALICLAIILGGINSATAEERANILFILADDLRWDALGYMNDPAIRTPHIDRLASEGVVFRNAFVTTAICAVSRASFITGQYARRHGVHDFVTPVQDLSGTYPGILRKNGYYTGFIGKWGIAAGNIAYMRRCALSFDYWGGDQGQTSYWHERTCRYATCNGTSQREDYHCDCPAEVWKAQGVRGGDGGPHPKLKDPVHLETWVIPHKVRQFLDQRDRQKPFCLSISLKAPHAPFSGYAPQFADRFEGLAMPRRPTVTAPEAARQPEFLRQSLGSDRGWRMAHDDSLHSERQKLFRHYYRLIEGIDECVGKLVEELQQRNLASKTVIIFTSDHGHMQGEHGFFGKWLMYEESIRVPLILYDPRAKAWRASGTCEALALNIDIAPTILDLAGIDPPPPMQGHSLRQALTRPNDPLRDIFFYEHLYEHGAKPPRYIEPSEGVRTRDWKYIRYIKQSGPECEELYHLAEDPLETRNRVRDDGAAEMLAKLRAEYETLRKELGPHDSWTRNPIKKK